MTNNLSVLVVGTRGSELAQWQTNYIIASLQKIVPDLKIETHIIKTSGDKDQTRSLADLGGLGAFTKEIENALIVHEIDLAVHSLKDLPTETADGLVIAAIPERADPRDCIVSRHSVGLMQLPRGARVGTSSARRSAQVLALRPDTQIVPLRGNVDTRLRKSQTDEYDAVVLAAAGIIRLGRANEITEYLPLNTFFPDPGQGALAVEIRADDAALMELVSQLNHTATCAAVTAERAFLRALGGGCRMPIGAFAEMRGEELHLIAMIASDDGTRVTRGETRGDPGRPEELGAELARNLVGTKHSPDQGSLQEMAGINQSGFSSDQDLTNASLLRGKKILITRAREQAGELAEKIRALGGEPVEFPTIEFAPVENFATLDDALAHASEFNWVVFTSANGVRVVAERLGATGLGISTFGSAKISAIGPATARVLQDLGLRVDFIPTKFLGEQIALELPIERGQRALLLRTDIASDVLTRGLQARGVAVTNIAAYRTILPSSNGRAVDLTKISAITFSSSSTVKNFVALLNDNATDTLTRAKIFCIGPVTAETACELGLRVDAIAMEHTIEGLVSAMVEYYQRMKDEG